MDLSIRSKLDQHLIAARTITYRTLPGGLFEVMPNWVRGFSGLETSIFNTFLPLKPAGLTDDTLADTAAFFSSRNVHYAVELIHDRFPDGPDFLTERRYQSLPPQLAMYLAGAPEDVPLNSDITIERVAVVPFLTAFCSLVHIVFGFPLKDVKKLFPVAYLKEDRIRLYLVFLDDEPVSGGMAVCVDGGVTICHMCTIDQYRNRGIATTLTHRMLADARKAGCDLAGLYSTPQAFNMYNRLGFEIYTQRQWFLPPGIDYEE
jgi:ribosomal protein S18 acetylase RimI-like enzyme